MLLIDEEKFHNQFNKISKDNQRDNIRVYGEVFTPEYLINEMLDKLPKKLWNDKSLKWFDFACGIGSFGFYIYKRLMIGLSDDIINEEQRSRYIIENMLYFNELQNKNVELLKQIFMSHKYKLNIYSCDFLNFNSDIKFDVIVSNPPYNISSQRAHGHTLWAKFVYKGVQFLNSGGYALFIHPSGWRKCKTNNTKNTFIYEVITRNMQMLYLELHNQRDGKKTFKCGTRYDWYLLKNVECYKKTVVKDENGKMWKIDLRKWDFIPNHSYDLIYEILSTSSNDKCRILYGNNCNAQSSYVSDKKDDVHKYTLIHTTTKNGPRYKYSSRNDIGFFGVKKVIWGDSGVNEPVIDINGEYGITNHSMAIQVSDMKEALKVKRCLMSDIFKQINSACMYSNYQLEWRIFLYFTKKLWDIIDNKILINEEN